jgi:hypothetical protein
MARRLARLEPVPDHRRFLRVVDDRVRLPFLERPGEALVVWTTTPAIVKAAQSAHQSR